MPKHLFLPWFLFWVGAILLHSVVLFLKHRLCLSWVVSIIPKICLEKESTFGIQSTEPWSGKPMRWPGLAVTLIKLHRQFLKLFVRSIMHDLLDLQPQFFFFFFFFYSRNFLDEVFSFLQRNDSWRLEISSLLDYSFYHFCIS